VPALQVQPRDTPAEFDSDLVEVGVDDALLVHASVIEDWTAPRPSWDFALREGNEFGRANNVEARLLFAAGEQTSSLVFRLDQLDSVEEFEDELVFVFEERDGIVKTVRTTGHGLDVDLHHILTYT
jgi:hypothetical protein